MITNGMKTFMLGVICGAVASGVVLFAIILAAAACRSAAGQ